MIDLLELFIGRTVQYEGMKRRVGVEVDVAGMVDGEFDDVRGEDVTEGIVHLVG